MRDGLQLEAPEPLDGKLAMLEALVATGVRRIEVTSFVSPKAVPALADADEVAAELHAFDGVLFSALVANARGATRAVDARSEEHTSELQSRQYLVCRLLLEKKKLNPSHANILYALFFFE